MSDELERLLKEQDDVIVCLTARAEKAEKDRDEAMRHAKGSLEAANESFARSEDLRKERDELAAQVVAYESAVRRFAETLNHVDFTDRHVTDTKALYELGKTVNKPHIAAARLMLELEALRHFIDVVMNEVFDNVTGSVDYILPADEISKILAAHKAVEAARGKE